MKMLKRLLKKMDNEKGVALLFAMMVLIMLTILGFAAIMTSTSDVKIVGNLKNASNSLFVAEGGIEEVKMRLNPLFGNYQFTQDSYPYSNSWGYYITSATATQLQSPSSSYYDPGYSVTPSLTLTTSLQNSVSWQWVKVYHLTDDFPVGHNGTVQCYRPNLFPKVGACPSASYSPVEVVTAMVNVKETQKEIVVQLEPVSSPKFKNAAFGVNSVSLSNNALTDSYTSVPNTNPAPGSSCPVATCTCNGGSGIATNGSATGAITIGNGNTKVCGTVTDGVGSTASTISNSGTITGTPQTQTATQNSAVTTPALPGNCTNITANLTNLASHPGTLDLSASYPAGTCFYASGTVNINNNQKVAFPTSASFYVTGSLQVSNNGYIYSISYAPSDLIIYGTSTATSIQLNNNGWVYAAVYSPTAVITIDNNGTYFGAVVGQSVYINNNGMIHYDSNLSNIPGSISSYINYSWNQLM